ncbi:hypothetical protein Dip510_000075 [Elusimicrobium posterum]|uniref:hypothetical protein n=1 Tax=Elusimicrobium posterum TaxID=3116653 RepID=UPI003C77EA74
MPNIEIISLAVLLCAGGFILLKAISYGREKEKQKQIKTEKKSDEQIDEIIRRSSVTGRDSLITWLRSLSGKK